MNNKWGLGLKKGIASEIYKGGKVCVKRRNYISDIFVNISKDNHWRGSEDFWEFPTALLSELFS